VTGANFLLTYKTTKLLVDCGLEQGSKMAEETNWDDFPYDPSEIQALIVTHAHLDHIGRIPKLINDGFRGVIYSTSATKDIVAVMLEDTNKILGGSKSHPELADIYNDKNLARALSLWKTKNYHEDFTIGDITINFKDAGHILGSVMAEMQVGSKKVLFTGDLGNSPSLILKDTEAISGIDYMVMESVYGDRNHEGRESREENLLKVINEASQSGGTLLVPTFSLERTQEMLFMLNDFAEKGLLPDMPIYVDSPLAIRVTRIFRKHTDELKDEARAVLSHDDDLYDFPGLKETLKVWESKLINRDNGPKMIIAASGMSEGGRIVHHEKRYLGDPNTIILFTGYQAENTAGRAIQDGEREVEIMDEKVSVRAQIRTVSGFSGHKDSDHLVEFVQGSAESLKKVFIAMGELKASSFLAQRLKGELGVSAKVVQKDEVAEFEV
ncbi:MBL fold metallo-hydrolase, partial [Candidatus Parcubacteria bacterium]|nr:MBL fold metallo-hydrolase [Candidatus Parcubacteria bacterium]